MGSYLAVLTIFKLILLPVAGIFADRINRANLLRCGFVVSGLGSLGLATLPSYRIELTLGMAALAGGGFALALPPLRAMIPDIVDTGGLELAQSLISATQGALALAVPAAAGALLTVVEPRTFILYEAVFFLIGAALIPFRRNKTVVPTRSDLSLQSLTKTVKYVATVRWVLAGMLQTMLQVVAGFAPGLILIRIVSDARYGEPGLGLILSATGLAALLGSLIAGKWNPKRKGLWANLGFVSYALVELCIAFDVPLSIFMLAITVGGVGVSFHGVWWIAAINRRFPQESRGQINALDTVATGALEPAGMAFALPLAGLIGVTGVGILGGAVFLVIPLIALLTPGLSRYSDATSRPSHRSIVVAVQPEV